MSDEFRHDPLVQLKWGDADEIGVSLEQLFRYSVVHAEKAIQWYVDHKGRKRAWGMILRVGAIISLAVAGVLPVLTQIFVQDGKPQIAPAWASVALAAGLALVALDRFFGFSSSWMRYTQTQLRLESLLGAFMMEWELSRLSSPAVATTPEAAQTLVLQANTFVKQVDAVVQEETSAWVTEFKEALQELEERVKTEIAAVRSEVAVLEPGAVNIVLTNGEECRDGWTLAIDGAEVDRRHSGKSATMTGLLPGIHRVRVEGIIANSARSAESSVSIPAREVVTTELTLT